MEKTKTECSILCYFINLNEESAAVAREETVRLVEKIIPYLILRNDREFQSSVAHAIDKLCEVDEESPVENYHTILFGDFIVKYGKVEHPVTKYTLEAALND